MKLVLLASVKYVEIHTRSPPTFVLIFTLWIQLQGIKEAKKACPDLILVNGEAGFSSISSIVDWILT